MVRLFKLAAYSLLGYVLYELVMGVADGEAEKASAQPEQKQPTRQKRGGGGSVPGNSPRTRGSKTVSVEDSTGVQHRQTVGRGVL